MEYLFATRQSSSVDERDDDEISTEIPLLNFTVLNDTQRFQLPFLAQDIGTYGGVSTQISLDGTGYLDPFWSCFKYDYVVVVLVDYLYRELDGRGWPWYFCYISWAFQYHQS